MIYKNHILHKNYNKKILLSTGLTLEFCTNVGLKCATNIEKNGLTVQPNDRNQPDLCQTVNWRKIEKNYQDINNSCQKNSCSFIKKLDKSNQNFCEYLRIHEKKSHLSYRFFVYNCLNRYLVTYFLPFCKRGGNSLQGNMGGGGLKWE